MNVIIFYKFLINVVCEPYTFTNRDKFRKEIEVEFFLNILKNVDF